MMGQQPSAPAAPAAPAAAAEQAVYSPDELSILQEYEKNWPDVAKAETLKRRAEYNDIFKFVFNEVAQYVAPLFEQVRTVGNTLHMNELTNKVPDYTENLETEVNNWIGTQPAYLQSAYNNVMQKGTSDEVADLIGRYRAATGAAPAPAAAAPAPATAAGAAPPVAPPVAAPKNTELSSAAKQAAASLAPVGGERSHVPQGEDTQDFDSAFKRYASTM